MTKTRALLALVGGGIVMAGVMVNPAAGRPVLDAGDYTIYLPILEARGSGVGPTVTRAAPAPTTLLPTTPVPTGTPPAPGDVVQIGGSSFDVAVTGGYAYLGAGPRVLALDISQPTDPRLVGQSELLPGVVHAAQASGGRLYVAAGRGGLQVLDISTATTPRRIGGAQTPDEAVGVLVDGSWAYVGYTPDGLYSFDITNPAAPVLRGQLQLSVAPGDDPPDASTLEAAMGLTLDGDRLYIAAPGLGLRVLDVANPAAPRELGSFAGAERFAGLGVLIESARAVAVAGDYAYLAAFDVLMLDVSDPAHPVSLGLMDGVTADVVDLVIFGNTLFGTGYGDQITMQADAGATLSVLDITDPSQPLPLADVGLPGAPAGLVVADGLLVAARGDAGGLVTVNVENAFQPAVTGRYDSLGFVHALSAFADGAYAMDLWEELYRLDLVSPAELRVRTLPAADGGWDLVADGQWLYVAGWDLDIYNLANPDQPRLAGQLELDWLADKVAVSGDTVYLGVGADLYVVDVANRTAPVRLAAEAILTSANDLLSFDRHVYVAESGWEFDMQLPPPYKIWVFDMSNPARPRAGTSLDFQMPLAGLAAAGDTLYVAALSGGLHSVDITTRDQPRRLAQVDLASDVSDVATDGTWLYAAGRDGWRRVDVADPARPHAVAFQPLPASPWEIEISDGMLWVADQEAGVIGYRLGR